MSLDGSQLLPSARHGGRLIATFKLLPLTGHMTGQLFVCLLCPRKRATWDVDLTSAAMLVGVLKLTSLGGVEEHDRNDCGRGLRVLEGLMCPASQTLWTVYHIDKGCGHSRQTKQKLTNNC